MTVKEFEILACRLRPRLISEARRLTGDADDAEDITQDTLLRLWDMRGDLSQYRSVEALSVLMARRLALNMLRSRQRHPHEHQDILLESLDTALSAEEALIARQQEAQLDAVLSALPDSQQTLLRMRHFEGYDIAVIARITGSSEGAVRTALSRARRSVARLFNIYE